MASDTIHLDFNGVAIVLIDQGIAEGGTMGPLTFPLYMDSLPEALHKAGCGVGVGARIPRIWAGRQWRGTGTPDLG
eukprot:2428827-Pyramimonas_sp.AAC.1